MFGFKPNRKVTPDDLGIFTKGSTQEGNVIYPNLFNRDKCKRGYAIASAGGGLITNAEYMVSDYIVIEPSTVYSWFKIFRMAFYDQNKAYISHTDGSTVSNSSGIVTTPTTAKYVRFSVSSVATHYMSAQFCKGRSVPQYEHAYGTINRTFLPHNYTRNRYTNYPMVDSDISGVFNKNVTIADSSVAIAESTATTVYDSYDALVTAYPTYITKTLLCNETSGDALPVYQYRFKPVLPTGTFMSRTMLPKLLILSGVHGNEKAAVWTLYNVLNNICNAWSTDPLLQALRFNFDLIVIPLVNPYGYNNDQRKNFNGVDLNRNYPAGWELRSAAAIDYGGTSPLTEIECQKINLILREQVTSEPWSGERLSTLLGVIDFHNFGASINGYSFLWAVGCSVFMSNLIRNHYQRMDRKWKADFPGFINADYDVFIGDSTGEAPGGSVIYQANYYGIKGAVSYEIGDKVEADPTSTRFDSNTMTMGYEAFVNWLLMFSNELMKHWHRQDNL
jgi:hypothetical protein